MQCFADDGSIPAECFDTIVQTMAEGVVLLDSSGAIRFTNKAMQDLCGMTDEELTGMRCSEVMVCACSSADECEFLSNNCDMVSAECSVRHRDGHVVPVLKNGRAIRAADGSLMGAVETLTDISELRDREQRIQRLESEVRERYVHHGLVGRSPAMQSVFELIDMAAASEATVLVTGETGTGKELVARAIHEQSARSDGPLVKVNSSALTESLLESELFGHVKGAFTGAIRDKIGRFEMANGGTLFLDEIGEISPLIQVKLLRFLQEKEFEPVGDSHTRRADVRIIAATNRDLLAMVRSGEFREDLYYRLKVFPIRLPRLRDRKQDVGLLVDHFIARFREETGRPIDGLTHEAAVALMDYCWPGNIRELENAIEHAFVTCREDHIGLFDLPLEVRRYELQDSHCNPPSSASSAAGGSPDPHIPLSVERIREALARSAGNRSEAARTLGIDRTTLWRWMKRHGIT